MNNFALGKYMPLNSPIHRMDPRAKIMAMLIVLIAIFFPAGFSGYAIIAVCAVAVVLIAKLSLNFVWRSMKPMLFMLLFLLIVNILVLSHQARRWSQSLASRFTATRYSRRYISQSG